MIQTSDGMLQLVPSNLLPRIAPRPVLLASLLDSSLIEFKTQSSQTWDSPSRVNERKKFCEVTFSKLHIGLDLGEIRCVIVPQKGSLGSVSPFIFQETEVISGTRSRESDATAGPGVISEGQKWDFGCCSIGQVPYLVASKNSDSNKGLNKTASKLVGREVRGPIVFILLDHDYKPTHMIVDMFKKLAISLLI